MKQYCLDSSSLMTAWRSSPPDFFLDFWKTLETYLIQKIFVLPEVTYQEIVYQDDGLSAIVEKHKKNCVQPMNEEIFEIQNDLNKKYLGRSANGVNENDLVIIATAQHLQMTLVTEEGWQPYREDPNQDVPLKNYKIPRVCKKEKIDFCRLIHVFFEQCISK